MFFNVEILWLRGNIRDKYIMYQTDPSQSELPW